MTPWKEYLETFYFNPESPGAFSGPPKLKNILKKAGYDISIDSIRNWLKDQDSYSLFKPVKHKFKRNRVITQGIDDLWDMDLADVNNLSKYNHGVKYLLIVIDVFSKYLWVETLPYKTH